MGYLKLLDQFEKEEIEGKGLKVNWRWHDCRMEFAIWLQVKADMQPTHPPESVAIVEEALGELMEVQFCDNTHAEATRAREEVAQIIRALAKRLTTKGL